MFTQGTDVQDSGLVDRDAWIAYLTANPPVSPDFARHSVAITGQPTHRAKSAATVAFDVSKLDLTSPGLARTNTTLAAVLWPADQESGLCDPARLLPRRRAAAAHVSSLIPAEIHARHLEPGAHRRTHRAPP